MVGSFLSNNKKKIYNMIAISLQRKKTWEKLSQWKVFNYKVWIVSVWVGGVLAKRTIHKCQVFHITCLCSAHCTNALLEHLPFLETNYTQPFDGYFAYFSWITFFCLRIYLEETEYLEKSYKTRNLKFQSLHIQFG